MLSSKNPTIINSSLVLLRISRAIFSPVSPAPISNNLVEVPEELDLFDEAIIALEKYSLIATRINAIKPNVNIKSKNKTVGGINRKDGIATKAVLINREDKTVAFAILTISHMLVYRYIPL